MNDQFEGHNADEQDSADTKASVAVIIAAYNAAETLAPQMEALVSQTCLFPYEVIVVDNGSTDATSHVVESFIARNSFVSLVSATDRPSAGYARNRGAAATSAELLLFCDADDVVAADWVEQTTSSLSDFDMAGGVVEEGRLNSETVQAWKPPRSKDSLVVAHNFLPHAIGANVGIRAHVFHDVGGWAECFPGGGGEDVELSWRVQLAGYSLGLADQSVVHYRHRESLRDLSRQYFRRGRNGRLVCEAYSQAMTSQSRGSAGGPKRAATVQSTISSMAGELTRLRQPAAQGRIVRQLSTALGWATGPKVSRTEYRDAKDELKSIAESLASSSTRQDS